MASAGCPVKEAPCLPRQAGRKRALEVNDRIRSRFAGEGSNEVSQEPMSEVEGSSLQPEGLESERKGPDLLQLDLANQIPVQRSEARGNLDVHCMSSAHQRAKIPRLETVPEGRPPQHFAAGTQPRIMRLKDVIAQGIKDIPLLVPERFAKANGRAHALLKELRDREMRAEVENRPPAHQLSPEPRNLLGSSLFGSEGHPGGESQAQPPHAKNNAPSEEAARKLALGGKAGGRNSSQPSRGSRECREGEPLGEIFRQPSHAHSHVGQELLDEAGVRRPSPGHIEQLGWGSISQSSHKEKERLGEESSSRTSLERKEQLGGRGHLQPSDGVNLGLGEEGVSRTSHEKRESLGGNAGSRLQPPRGRTEGLGLAQEGGLPPWHSSLWNSKRNGNRKGKRKEQAGGKCILQAARVRKEGVGGEGDVPPSHVGKEQAGGERGLQALCEASHGSGDKERPQSRETVWQPACVTSYRSTGRASEEMSEQAGGQSSGRAVQGPNEQLGGQSSSRAVQGPNEQLGGQSSSRAVQGPNEQLGGQSSSRAVQGPNEQLGGKSSGGAVQGQNEQNGGQSSGRAVQGPNEQKGGKSSGKTVQGANEHRGDPIACRAVQGGNEQARGGSTSGASRALQHAGITPSAHLSQDGRAKSGCLATIVLVRRKETCSGAAAARVERDPMESFTSNLEEEIRAFPFVQASGSGSSRGEAPRARLDETPASVGTRIGPHGETAGPGMKAGHRGDSAPLGTQIARHAAAVPQGSGIHHVRDGVPSVTLDGQHQGARTGRPLAGLSDRGHSLRVSLQWGAAGPRDKSKKARRPSGLSLPAAGKHAADASSHGAPAGPLAGTCGAKGPGPQGPGRALPEDDEGRPGDDRRKRRRVAEATRSKHTSYSNSQLRRVVSSSSNSAPSFRDTRARVIRVPPAGGAGSSSSSQRSVRHPLLQDAVLQAEPPVGTATRRRRPGPPARGDALALREQGPRQAREGRAGFANEAVQTASSLCGEAGPCGNQREQAVFAEQAVQTVGSTPLADKRFPSGRGVRAGRTDDVVQFACRADKAVQIAHELPLAGEHLSRQAVGTNTHPRASPPAAIAAPGDPDWEHTPHPLVPHWPGDNGHSPLAVRTEPCGRLLLRACPGPGARLCRTVPALPVVMPQKTVPPLPVETPADPRGSPTSVDVVPTRRPQIVQHEGPTGCMQYRRASEAEVQFWAPLGGPKAVTCEPQDIARAHGIRPLWIDVETGRAQAIPQGPPFQGSAAGPGLGEGPAWGSHPDVGGIGAGPSGARSWDQSGLCTLGTGTHIGPQPIAAATPCLLAPGTCSYAPGPARMPQGEYARDSAGGERSFASGQDSIGFGGYQLGGTFFDRDADGRAPQKRPRAAMQGISASWHAVSGPGNPPGCHVLPSRLAATVWASGLSGPATSSSGPLGPPSETLLYPWEPPGRLQPPASTSVAYCDADRVRPLAHVHAGAEGINPGHRETYRGEFQQDSAAHMGLGSVHGRHGPWSLGPSGALQEEGSLRVYRHEGAPSVPPAGSAGDATDDRVPVCPAYVGGGTGYTRANPQRSEAWQKRCTPQGRTDAGRWCAEDPQQGVIRYQNRMDGIVGDRAGPPMSANGLETAGGASWGPQGTDGVLVGDPQAVAWRQRVVRPGQAGRAPERGGGAPLRDLRAPDPHYQMGLTGQALLPLERERMHAEPYLQACDGQQCGQYNVQCGQQCWQYNRGVDRMQAGGYVTESGWASSMSGGGPTAKQLGMRPQSAPVPVCSVPVEAEGRGGPLKRDDRAEESGKRARRKRRRQALMAALELHCADVLESD
eukprot:jgi/Botrbrau1/3584/Bobra.0078s0036.1